VQLQIKSSELTYAIQQLGWSSGKAERLIAEILQIIDSKRLLLLSAPKVRKTLQIPDKVPSEVRPGNRFIPAFEYKHRGKFRGLNAAKQPIRAYSGI
jgi:hypothetical protein